MQIAHSPWWIFLILLLFRMVECDEEKIKRAIYNYQRGPKENSGGKSNEDYFKNFQGASPFEQVLAALGLSGDDQSKIHTSVEYWPPDMDREKFYQMVKGEVFPFTSWNHGIKPHSAPTPSSINYKPIFENIRDDQEVPQKISRPVKKPENSHKNHGMKSLPANYYPPTDHHVSVSYAEFNQFEEKVTEQTPQYVKSTSKAPKYIEKVPPVFEDVYDYPEYPTYIEKTSKAPKQIQKLPEVIKENPKYFNKPPEVVKETPKYFNKLPDIAEETPIYFEQLPEVVKEIPKNRTPKIKEVFKHQQEAPKFHYILQTPKSPEKYPKVHDEIAKVTKKAPRIVEVTPKVIMEVYTTTTTTLKPKAPLVRPKYFIHTSKIPAQPELPSSPPASSFDGSVTSSSAIENAWGNDDISMTDAGPVLFPEVTTSRNKVQRGSVKTLIIPQNHREHVHEENSQQQNQQQPPRSNKKRKLKKKVKTSSIAQEVVDIGYRGSSGTLQTPPRTIDVIGVTSTTIAPKTSFTASTSVNFIANDAVTDDIVLASGDTTHLSDGYVDPNYSHMIDNLSKLTELSFNTNAKDYKPEIGNDYVHRIYSSTVSTKEFSPVTETFNNHKFEFDNDKNSSIVTDENMIAVLNLMKNATTTISSSSMEELKKAVIENNLPKVKKIVRQYIGKRPVSDNVSSTTESSSVTRGKLLRSRFGVKTKVTASTTESSSTISLKSSSSSTLKAKILKKPVTTVKQVISTTARSSRQSNRTRPSITPRSTTSRSTKSIARRITTTRKSIKSAASA